MSPRPPQLGVPPTGSTDSIDSIDPELDALLDSERHAPGASPAARQRVAARLSLTVGVIGLAAGQASAGQVSGSLPAAGAKVFAWKWLAAGLTSVAVLGGIASGVWWSHRSQLAPLAPVVVPAALPVAEPAPQLVAPAVEPAVEPPVPKPAAHRRANPSSEYPLVEGARSALQHNDIAGALRLCARHQDLFPHGSLVEERDSIVILALGAAHRADEAASRAARFRNRYPGSLFLPAIEAAVENAREP